MCRSRRGAAEFALVRAMFASARSSASKTVRVVLFPRPSWCLERWLRWLTMKSGAVPLASEADHLGFETNSNMATQTSATAMARTVVRTNTVISGPPCHVPGSKTDLWGTPGL
jgi:hypothetical protein